MAQEGHDRKESFAPDVESREGGIPVWLIIVYVIVAVWGIYYLMTYWNSAGPG